MGPLAMLAAAAALTQAGSVVLDVPVRGGAAMGAGSVVTWGPEGLRRWSVPALRGELLVRGDFGEGGCTTDLDGDGSLEFVGVVGEGLGRLVHVTPPDWRLSTIDTQIAMHDCLEATLFGRRGVLIIQRGMQVRFYERDGGGKWKSRDLYSIYTPSYQGGLALADVNGDGRTDIFCGNYWMRSPERFELSWKLFAINTWSEGPESALFRVVPLGRGSQLAISQAHAREARIAIFTRPRPPEDMWPVRLLGTGTNVHALLAWQGSLLAGERDGPASRLMRIDPTNGEVHKIAEGTEILTLLDAGPDTALAVGPDSLTLWRRR